MKNLAIFIFLSAFSLVLTDQLEDQRRCCDKYSSFNLSSETCVNNDRPGLYWSCSGGKFSVDTSTVDPTRFQTDYKGKYVTLSDDVIVRRPNYCIANTTGGFAKVVLLYCTLEIIKSSEEPLDVQALLFVVMMLLYAISCVLFGITALIYIIIPQTQDIEGKCTSNLTLMQCLFNMLVFSFMIVIRKENIEVENHSCSVEYALIVFPVLSSFIWYTVLAYHILCRFRQNFRIDESKLMVRYLSMGYGIPAIIILLSFIHFALFKRPYKKCIVGDFQVLFIYVVLPTIIIELVCAYFFVRLQYQLWNVQPVNSPMHSTSVVKKLKFRLLLNVKLFILSGLPRFLIILSVFLAIIFPGEFLKVHIPLFLLFLMSFEGILTFYMMVIRRKRVYQGLVAYIGCILPKKQSSPESEESDGSEEGKENEINGEI